MYLFRLWRWSSRSEVVCVTGLPARTARPFVPSFFSSLTFPSTPRQSPSGPPDARLARKPPCPARSSSQPPFGIWLLQESSIFLAELSGRQASRVASRQDCLLGGPCAVSPCVTLVPCARRATSTICALSPVVAAQPACVPVRWPLPIPAPPPGSAKASPNARIPQSSASAGSSPPCARASAG